MNLDHENRILKEENKILKEELDFYKQIFEFPLALVYQMAIKTKSNKKVWINKQKITIEELLELDQDEEIKKLISEKNTRYNDYDW